MVSIKDGDEVLFIDPTGKTFLKKICMMSFHTHHGVISLNDLIGKPYGSTVKTSTDKSFIIVKPDLRDLLAKKLRRGPQIIHRKDIGLIITHLGLTRDSVVLEAGTGSAYLTSHLGSICKKVVTCELREDHFKKASENIAALGLEKNVDYRNIDVESAPGKDYDAIILDMPKQEDIIPKVCKKLKIGGRIAVYSPCVDQSMMVCNALEENGFIDVVFMECMIREWGVNKGTRPNTMMLGHTGFLVFARYMGSEM